MSNKLRLFTVAPLVLASAAASGQQAQSSPSGIRLEPFVLYPSVTAWEGYNSNVILQNQSRVRSAVSVISPALAAELKNGTSAYRLTYTGTFGRYDKSNSDNYDYHELHGTADLDFSVRSKLNLVADFAAKSDPRGSNLTSIGISTPNKYRQEGFGGTFSYGAQGAKGRIEVESYFNSKRYLNNRAVTDILDFDSQRYSGTFFWRVAPKTEVLFQGMYIHSNYISNNTLADNDETRAFIGLKWDATAATSGTFKIGYSNKDFTQAGTTDAKGFIWDGSVRWSPLTYSTVDFSTGKNFNDPSGTGNLYTVDRYINLKWTHSWTSRVRSELYGGYSTDDYLGLGRYDKTSFVGLKGYYDMRRWLTFAVEYTYTQRDTNVPSAVYDKDLFMVSAKIAL